MHREDEVPEVDAQDYALELAGLIHEYRLAA